MNAISGLLLVVLSGMLLTLPRHRAAVPLLIGVLYMTNVDMVEIGPAHFTMMRLLVLIGFLRVMMRGEHLAHGYQTLDRVILWWAGILLFTGLFRDSGAIVYRSGIIWTELGCYFLFRIFVRDLDEAKAIVRFLCFALVPLAILMVLEKQTGRNPFAMLGGVDAISIVRHDQVRAGGPFDHPIFAGMVGACGMAYGMATWPSHRLRGLAGFLAGLAIVVAGASSGPMLMAFFLLIGRMAWMLRRHMRLVRWTIFTGLVALDAVMQDPVYFLMARIDVAGGSQSYFRAALVRSAINHISEWWLAGTDYTRHWMASGIHANSKSTDITNHFLAMGVSGGLPLMFVFVLVIAYAFRDAGRALQQAGDADRSSQLFIWTQGALIFGFVMFFWSISLYDHSVALFYLTFAVIQSALQPERLADVPSPSVSTARA